MKKIFFMCVVGFLVSCQQDLSMTNVDMAKIDNIKSLDEATQRLSYNLLNSNERQFIWNEHFQSVIEKNNLNDEQRNLVLELKSMNVVKFHNDAASLNSIRVIEKDWTARASKVFSKTEILNLAYRIGRTDLGVHINLATDPPNCSCNINSAFSCDQYSTCGPATCTVKRLGCGFLFLFDCNGLCHIGGS